MTYIIEEKYEEYKKYGNIITDYDEILVFYPDYYKTKVELENTKFIDKYTVDEYFEGNYKDSELYKRLVELNMDEAEIYQYMKENKNIKYVCIKALFVTLVQSTIKLCRLIDYIGHYPTTWPVPKEEEKNPAMERLLEKYDISIRYHLDDEIDKMQITSNDIVRIIDKLNENLDKLDSMKSKLKTNDWITKRKIPSDKLMEETERLMSEINEFPPSNYQKQGKSKREEGKYYLRLQYGKNII